jgi:EAL domain-containing protein (putative c-di-GMP-specific phosphodiesterase class I)
VFIRSIGAGSPKRQHVASMHPTAPIRVLIADDIPELRTLLRATLQGRASRPASAATTLKRLSALGVRVSVDDFGTGYSSLASLQYLRLFSLKIDRSFAARLDLDPSDDAMVAAVIGLGHTLGLTVIAGGVETPGQLAKLDQLGCDYAQGYLFARPGTASRVGELLGHDPRWQ